MPEFCTPTPEPREISDFRLLGCDFHEHVEFGAQGRAGIKVEADVFLGPGDAVPLGLLAGQRALSRGPRWRNTLQGGGVVV